MKWLFLTLLVILAGCDSGSKSPKTCSATVVWEPPTETTDGHELRLEDIEKFTIYISSRFSVDPEDLISVNNITDPNTIVWEMRVDKGRNYFYMTVTDKGGVVSTYSNIILKQC